MKRIAFGLSCLSVLGLLLSSCAPAAAPTTVPRATEPSQKVETPVAKPTTAPAAPAATSKPAADQVKTGGILKYAARQDEGTLDLHVTGRNLAAEQAGLGYSGLLQYDPEDGRKVINDLAEGYQISTDGKKVTFALRKNVKWHDGNPFTSADVKFNFDRWMNPPEGVAITRKEIVAAVDRVATPDPYTVEVYLKYPSPFFIAGIALISGAMLPPQYLKDHKTMEFTILGTGPFKLKKYNRGASLEYVKNENYFVPGRPYLDGIIQYIVPDETARFAAFRTGQVKTVFSSSATMTATHADMLRSQMTDKVNVARFAGMVMGILYENVTTPPFNDLKVRQAVDMALDRKKMIDVVEGRGDVVGPMVRGPWALPDDELMKRPGYRGVTAQDVEKAKALLAEAGYPRGFSAEMMSTQIYTNQAVFVQSQLKSIGIDATIKMVDTGTLEKRFVSRDFALSFYLPGHPIDEPDLFLSFWVTGGGRNYGGVSDKEVDALYDQQSKEMDTAKRKELVLQAQRKILDLAGSPVLYHHLYETAYWKCVKGYYPEKRIAGHNDVKRQDVWLDEGCR